MGLFDKVAEIKAAEALAAKMRLEFEKERRRVEEAGKKRIQDDIDIVFNELVGSETGWRYAETSGCTHTQVEKPVGNTLYVFRATPYFYVRENPNSERGDQLKNWVIELQTQRRQSETCYDREDFENTLAGYLARMT